MVGSTNVKTGDSAFGVNKSCEITAVMYPSESHCEDRTVICKLSCVYTVLLFCQYYYTGLRCQVVCASLQTVQLKPSWISTQRRLFGSDHAVPFVPDGWMLLPRISNPIKLPWLRRR